MAIQINIDTVNAFEVADGSFAVRVKAANGTWYYHVGPADFAFFTAAQSQSLANKVYAKGEINAKYWVRESGTSYGDEAHELALIEIERAEAYWA